MRDLRYPEPNRPHPGFLHSIPNIIQYVLLRQPSVSVVVVDPAAAAAAAHPDPEQLGAPGLDYSCPRRYASTQKSVDLELLLTSCSGASGPQPQDDYAFSYQFDGM